MRKEILNLICVHSFIFDFLRSFLFFWQISQVHSTRTCIHFICRSWKFIFWKNEVDHSQKIIQDISEFLTFPLAKFLQRERERENEKNI